MTFSQIVPTVILALVAWRVYLRARRHVGRQPFRPVRLTVSILVFSAITLLVGLASMFHSESLTALGGGLLLALPLALIGLNLTRFERTPDGRFYTPNTAIGITLAVLLVGRLAYRLLVWLSGSSETAVAPPGIFHSPMTLVVFGVTAGYYIAYYSGVLMRARRLPPSP